MIVYAIHKYHFEDLEIGTIVGGRIYYIRYSNDPKQFSGDLLIILKRSSIEITKQKDLSNQPFTYHGGYS